MAGPSGTFDLRKESVSRIVTGFALQEYKFKQVCMIEKSTSWKETYFRETSAELTGGTGSAVRGVPRLANFPYGNVTYSEISDRLEKYAMEAVISWEDATTNEFGIIARTLLRVARAVASAVDARIYTLLSDNAGNTVTISAGNEWNSNTLANRDPIQDILNAIREIQLDNYDPFKNGYLLLNPTDFANIMGNANVRNAGQFWTSDVTKNGRVGRILGLTMINSTGVASDEALVVVGKEAATWKEAHTLSTETISDPGIKWTIRSWEVGVLQVTNPNAICKITNTLA